MPPPHRWGARSPVPHRPQPAPHTEAEAAALAVLAAAVVLAAWVWFTAEIAAWLHSGTWARVTFRTVAAAVVTMPHHLSEPRQAWPAAIRKRLPGPIGMYGCAAAIFAVAGLLTTAHRVWRRRSGTRPRLAAPRSGGATWASFGDLRRLRTRRPGQAGRLALGWLGAPWLGRGSGAWLGRRVVATESRHSVLVLGPTQSGKTTGLAIPALLEWTGPVLATSVKDDLAQATRRWRQGSGPCWIFDPTASSGLSPTARWSPLAACETWSEAQRTSSWLVDATPARRGMADAAFWYAAAAKQMAPLLLAAARSGATMAEVVRWTNAGDFEEPWRILELWGDADAALALTACAARDERIRSSVATTLETVLAPFEDPTVSMSTAASDIDLADFLSSRGSLYLCGPSHEQHRIQGLFAVLVAAVTAEVFRRTTERGGLPLDPPLLLVLDEAANIAPVRDLDTLASTAAGIGIQLVTVCQDLAQLTARYGVERARTIANNHRAKILLSGVSDLSTLDLMSGLAGEAALVEDSFTHDLRDGRRTRSSATAFRRLAPTDELRRIQPGHAVLIYGHLPPARLRLRPWFADRGLRRRAATGSGSGSRSGVGYAVGAGGFRAWLGGLRARLGATRGGSPGILG